DDRLVADDEDAAERGVLQSEAHHLLAQLARQPRGPRDEILHVVSPLAAGEVGPGLRGRGGREGRLALGRALPGRHPSRHHFPRAPISAPWAAAAISAPAPPSTARRAATTAARTVWSMLVPVSPSGTGYTLSRFT